MILLGSKSGQKEAILHSALETLLGEGFELVSLSAASGITEQPLDAETTMRGSINRAYGAVEIFDGDYDFSFGLEAGLEMVEGIYHLICVATILDRDGKCAVGHSGLVPLPQDTSERVSAGGYLGDMIREYRDKPELSNDERVAVENLIDRKSSFNEAILDAWAGFEK